MTALGEVVAWRVTRGLRAGIEWCCKIEERAPTAPIT
jgi:hypothetical protein